MSDLPKRTAKEFEEPLLRVLLDQTGGKAGTEVPSENTYNPILALLGISSVNDYGMNDATGIPQVVKWIQWAFRSLKDQGLGQPVRRGTWSLTDKGIQAARGLSNMQPQPAAQVTTMTIPTPAPQATPAPAITVPALGRGYKDDYHQDPYIRHLAFERVNCGGNWSSRSDRCKACGLSGSCRNVQAGIISQLATKLAEEDTAAAATAAAAKVKATGATPAPATGAMPAPANPAPTKPAGLDTDIQRVMGRIRFETAEPFMVRVDTPCELCGQTLPAGTRSYYVEATGGQDCCALHTECYDKIQAALAKQGK